MALYTREQLENTLRPLGYTGNFTGGTADAFIASNPAAGAAMQELYRQVTAKPSNQYSGGVMPLSAVPMNAWEKTALQRAAAGVNPATVQRDPYAEKFLGNVEGLTQSAQQMYQQGAAPVTAADIQAQFNPYEEQVIGAAKTGLSRQAEALKAQLLKNARQSGAASFGSTVTQNPMNELRRGLLETTAGLESDLRYKGYGDAFNRALVNRQLSTTGASGLSGLLSGMGNLATQAQNIGSNAVAIERGNINAQLGAGQTLRDYQQRIADMSLADYMAEQGYSLTQAANTSALLAGLQSGLQNETDFRPSSTATTAARIASIADILGRAGGTERFI